MSTCIVCSIGLTENEAKEGICFKCESNIFPSGIKEDKDKQIEAYKEKIKTQIEKNNTIRIRAEEETATKNKIINDMKSMLLVTSEQIAGYDIIKSLGLVRGSTVRSKHIGRDIMADVKSLVGGEIKGYTEMLAESREQAIYRMKEDAMNLGADAVISVRINTAQVMDGSAEIIAYGTAVKMKVTQ